MSKLTKNEMLVLAFLKEEFIQKNRESMALKKGYEGPKMGDITHATAIGPVDFELAIDSLSKSKHIRTGPMRLVEFENESPSIVIFPFMASDKKFAYLTVLGYQVDTTVSNRRQPKPHTTTHSIVINGGTFSNNQMASGSHIHQQQQNKVEGPSERLLGLLSQENISITPQIETEVNQLVEVAEAGDTGGAKSRFRTIFEGVGEKAKTLGWEIITKLIMQQLQLP
jgi:hypothetical protein